MRFAVPFFFIVSGYFIAFSRQSKIEAIRKTAIRLIVPFIFWVVLYQLAFGTFGDLHDPGYVARLLLFGGPAYHLWFLPTLGFSLFLLICLRDVPLPYLFAGAAVMYVVGLVFGFYHAVLGVEYFHHGTRNGPFASFLFVLVGFALAKRPVAPTFRTGAVMALAGLVLSCVETLMLEPTVLSHVRKDFVVGTIPFGTGIFIMALSMRPSSRFAPLVTLGKWSLGFYCIHVFFVHAVSKLVAPTPLTIVPMVAAVVVLSIVTVMALSRIRTLRPVLG